MIGRIPPLPPPSWQPFCPFISPTLPQRIYRTILPPPTGGTPPRLQPCSPPLSALFSAPWPISALPRRNSLAIFIAIGVTGTALLYFIQTGDWLLASIFFIIGNIGFAGSLVYYDALLPHVARHDEIDQVSTRGYAMGYIGGGILLAINLVMIMILPDTLGVDTALMTRLTFVTVAVWWLIFSIPIMLHVKEPPRKIEADEKGAQPSPGDFQTSGQNLPRDSPLRPAIPHVDHLLGLFQWYWYHYHNGNHLWERAGILQHHSDRHAA